MPRGALKEARDDTLLADAGDRVLIVGDDRPIRISAGHRILHHDGKCSRPHGHNYEITVRVTGGLTEEGWVVDKGHITSIISEWDHMFLLERGDPLIEGLHQSGDEDCIVRLDHPPTAEVMSAVLERKLLEEFPDSVSDVAVQIRETSELCAGASR